MAETETIKIKFTRSLYPYLIWEVVDFPKHKFTNLVKSHSEVVEKWEVKKAENKMMKKDKIKNKKV